MKKVVFLLIFMFFSLFFVGCGKVDEEKMVVHLQIARTSESGFRENNFIKEAEEEIKRFVIVDFESLTEQELNVVIDCLKIKWGVGEPVEVKVDKTSQSIFLVLGEGPVNQERKIEILRPIADCEEF